MALISSMQLPSTQPLLLLLAITTGRLAQPNVVVTSDLIKNPASHLITHSLPRLWNCCYSIFFPSILSLSQDSHWGCAGKAERYCHRHKN